MVISEKIRYFWQDVLDFSTSPISNNHNGLEAEDAQRSARTVDSLEHMSKLESSEKIRSVMKEIRQFWEKYGLDTHTITITVRGWRIAHPIPVVSIPVRDTCVCI